MENYDSVYGAILFYAEDFKRITGHAYRQGTDICLVINGDANAHDGKMYAVGYRPINANEGNLVVHVLTSGGSTMSPGPFRFDYIIICRP